MPLPSGSKASELKSSAVALRYLVVDMQMCFRCAVAPTLSMLDERKHVLEACSHACR